MPSVLFRDLMATKLGNEPETFQFLADHEPQNSWFQELCSIDLRALAALRVLMGVIAIVFVYQQFAWFDLLYTEQGILSRDLNQQLIGPGFWSIFWLNESITLARSLLVVTGLAACFYILGCQTKAANLVLLVLLWSIQVRNPLVLTGGDVLLRMMLFWSLFLPVNAVWSVDASHSDSRPNAWKVASVATLAIMLQLVYMYFFSGISKLNPFWINGDAIDYTLHLEMSVKPWREWLAGYGWFNRLATRAVLIAELLILPLVFIPRLHQFNRGLMLGFFLLMHLGIWFVFSIGLFSLTAIACWVIFIPGNIWNACVGEPVGYEERRFYKSKELTIDKLAGIVSIGFLGYVTLQNVWGATSSAENRQDSLLEKIGRATMTIQQFQMFDQPPLFSPWFGYNAQLDHGESVDLFDPSRSLQAGKPDSVYHSMQSQNWRRIHWNLITHPLYPPQTELVYREIRRRLLMAIVNRWDAENPDNPVVQAELVCHLQPITIRPDKGQRQFLNHQPFDITWATYERK